MYKEKPLSGQMTNKLKPFDLQAALKGEPVMLRDGSKAFVRHHETEEVVLSTCRIWGLVLSDDTDEPAIRMSWTQQGRVISSKVDDNLDIIGMRPTRIVNGFEVPAPEVKERVPKSYRKCFSVDFTSPDYYEEWTWFYREVHLALLNRGLVFLNKDDAIVNAKAMLGIDPYNEEK